MGGKKDMKPLLTLEFEGLPPTVNMMYRSSGTTRYKRQAVKDWQEDIVGLLCEQWTEKKIPYRNRAEVSIEFTVQDRRAWDIDNRIKSLLDCFEMAGVLKNDSQIDSLHVKRHSGEKNKTKITLMEYKRGGVNDQL